MDKQVTRYSVEILGNTLYKHQFRIPYVGRHIHTSMYHFWPAFRGHACRCADCSVAGGGLNGIAGVLNVRSMYLNQLLTKTEFHLD